MCTRMKKVEKQVKKNSMIAERKYFRHETRTWYRLQRVSFLILMHIKSFGISFVFTRLSFC